MGVKFGTEEGTEGPLRAKFFPLRCNDKSIEPQKLKILLRFDRNVENRRPAGAYPLRHFDKICTLYTPFQMLQVLKFRWICSRGYGAMGVLSWQGLVTTYSQIFSAP